MSVQLLGQRCVPPVQRKLQDDATYSGVAYASGCRALHTPIHRFVSVCKSCTHALWGGVAITSARVSLVRAMDVANPALLRKYLNLIDIVSQTTYKSHLTHEKW